MRQVARCAAVLVVSLVLAGCLVNPADPGVSGDDRDDTATDRADTVSPAGDASPTAPAYQPLRAWSGGPVTWVLAARGQDGGDGRGRVLAVLRRDGGSGAWSDVTPAGVRLIADGGTGLDAWFHRERVWLAGVAEGGPSGRLTLLQTRDVGRTWERRRLELPEIEHAGGIFLEVLNARDARLLVTSDAATGAVPKTVYASSDGGRSWRRLATAAAREDRSTPGAPPRAGHPSGVAFADGFHGWITSRNHGRAPFEPYQLVRTLDGGRTWRPQPLPAPPVVERGSGEVFPPRFRRGVWYERHRALLPVLYRAGETERLLVYRSDDGGASWRPPADVTAAPAGDLLFDLAGTGRGLAVDRRDGRVYRTADGGATWEVAAVVPAFQSATGLEGGWVRTGRGDATRLWRPGEDGGWEPLSIETVMAMEPPMLDRRAQATSPRAADLRQTPMDGRGVLQGPDVAEAARGLAQYLEAPRTSPATTLEELFQLPGGIFDDGSRLYAPADLDGDGAWEWATVLNVRGDPWPRGSILVVEGGPLGYRVHRAPQSDLPSVRLWAVTDLAGDERPEIVWSTTEPAAHSPPTFVWVSRWSAARLQRLPGIMRMTSLRTLQVEGRQLVMHGGIVASAGAGPVQRERTDRYAFEDGRFRLADRRYAPSDHGYFRLLDGLAAERVGRRADAAQAYVDSLEPERLTLPDWMLGEPGDDTLPARERSRFDAAVRALARFRLGLLWLRAGEVERARDAARAARGTFAGLPRLIAAAVDGGGDATARACREARAWAEGRPDFIDAVNLPWGYVRPSWTAANLCSRGVPD